MLKDFIKQLSMFIPLKNDGREFFYSLMKTETQLYIERLKLIPSEVLTPVLNNKFTMSGNPTKQRFINLMKDIVSECINILRLSYNGDTFQATAHLKSLLTDPKATKKRLADTYANFFKFEVSDEKYYRCVPFKDDEPKNCNHLPFNLRYKASTGRFNQLGTICFYASSSEELASNSIHIKANDERKKYISEFKPRNNMYFLNLSVPTNNDINKMNEYDQFAFLVTYPFLLLCLTECKDGNRQFIEEYLFSQLLFYLLYQSDEDKVFYYHGICYTPIGNVKGRNIVVPIKYKKGEEPKNEGHSKYLSDMFKETKGPFPYF